MTAKRRSTFRVSSPHPPSAAVQNLLLAALPKADRDRVASTLDVVPLKLKELLHKPDERIGHVYFPGGGFCSVVTVLEDGRMVEVATIGREGAVGVTAVFDERPGPSASMVQGANETCYRMTASAFRREMDRRGAFYELLTRYSQALVGFIMQSTACNAVHTVEQRLARWLLMAQDRMESEEFPLTGIRIDDAGHDSTDREPRRRHVAESWPDQISPWSSDGAGPTQTRRGLV